MSIEQLSAIAQIVASAGVIVSLIFVGVQIRQNTGQLRLEQMLQEYAWASFHILDRTQRGVFPKGTFEATAGALLSVVLRTVRGADWWRGAKHVGFHPAFVADVDAVLAGDRTALHAG